MACPEGLFFDKANHRCVKEIKITNVDGLQSFIETGNYTRANIKKQLEELAETRKTTLCPLKTPVASVDGQSCTKCETDEYVDLRNLRCKSGQETTNIDAL